MKINVYYCFVVFRRICEYISLDLFCFVRRICEYISPDLFCFVRRIGEYISPDLFYSINLTSGCSLITEDF